MNKGIFVSFEGTEGAGKSTLIRRLTTELRKKGKKVLVTREPGGPPVSEAIRKIILSRKMDPWTELFLYEASRAQHVREVILPALKEGKVILCDRFSDSSLAYQAHARGLPWKQVHELNRLATRGCMPDVTFFLDVDPKVGLKRAKDRNRFEREGVRFQEKVRQGFLKAKRIRPGKWRVLSIGKLSRERVFEEAYSTIEKILKRKKIAKKK